MSGGSAEMADTDIELEGATSFNQAPALLLSPTFFPFRPALCELVALVVLVLAELRRCRVDDVAAAAAAVSSGGGVVCEAIRKGPQRGSARRSTASASSTTSSEAVLSLSLLTL